MFESEEIKGGTVVINVPTVKEWTLSELRYCCKKHKVKGYTKMNKDELIKSVDEIIKTIKNR